jgi:predicted ATPase
MLQARLSQLDPAARRVLRAASVFGQTFWRGGLVRMLGSDVDGLDRWIEHLVAMEHLERHRESRLGKEPEFAFRHSLLREAVYSLLTDFDRRAGHLAAAHYLREAGEGASSGPPRTICRPPSTPTGSSMPTACCALPTWAAPALATL